MIEPLKIINKISGYKTLKINHLERYEFKKSDNAYLVKTGALLSFGNNNFTQLLGEYDPIGFSEVILAKTKQLKYKILSDLELYSFSDIHFFDAGKPAPPSPLKFDSDITLLISSYVTSFDFNFLNNE